jgi:hypothetical protein
MADSKCSVCGTSNGGVLHQHHTKGRKVSDETITLCPNCHYFNHASALLVDNEASRLARAEIGSRLVSAEQYQAILDKHGYKPFFDGEEEWIEANT